MCLATILLSLVLVTSCDRDAPELEVRTFDVGAKTHEVRDVGKLIQPYVYDDRPDAPGSMSIALGAITVRETPDNLDRIARVLADLDLSEAAISSSDLHFLLVEANGAPEPDPLIADLVEELRKTLRFEGYSLLGESRIAVGPQTVYRQVLRTATSEYSIDGSFVGSGPSNLLSVDLRLKRSVAGEFTTTTNQRVLSTDVGIRKNQTLVLGTVPVEGSATLLLVVRLTDA